MRCTGLICFTPLGCLCFLCFYNVDPNGVKYNSIGQRPMNEKKRATKPCKGDIKSYFKFEFCIIEIFKIDNFSSISYFCKS